MQNATSNSGLEIDMPSEKRKKVIGWTAQILAAIGTLVWIGIISFLGLYPVAVIVAVFAVPATICNIIREAASAKSFCPQV